MVNLAVLAALAVGSATSALAHGNVTLNDCGMFSPSDTGTSKADYSQHEL